MNEADQSAPIVEQSQPQPQPAPPVSPTKSPRWLKIIVIGGAVVLLAFLTGSAIYLIATQRSSPKEVACTQEAKLCPDSSYVSRTGSNCVFAPCPISTPDPTADWRTYTSNQIPVTFQYPPVVEATKLGGPGDRIPSGGYEFREGGVMIRPLTSKYEIYLRITTLTNSGDSSYEWSRINQLYNVSVGESPQSGLVEFVRKQNIIINNITAHSYENERSKYPTSASRLIVFKKDDSYYTIETTYSLMADPEEKTKYSKIFDQILSTFKFLPASDSPTPGIERIVITEKDSGKSFSFNLRTQASLRLTNQYLWKTPQVDGRAVRLVRVDYIRDPGFSEWNIEPVEAGRAKITSSGVPNCVAGMPCPNITVPFEIEITVSSQQSVHGDKVIEVMLLTGYPEDFFNSGNSLLRFF